MRVTFKNSNGQERDIGNVVDFNDVFKVIKSFLDEKNYKSYYTRYWKNEKGIYIFDVGSHTEFFYLYPNVELIL